MIQSTNAILGPGYPDGRPLVAAYQWPCKPLTDVPLESSSTRSDEFQPPWTSLRLLDDRVCKICIGSLQGYKVWISNFRAQAVPPPTYSATLHYQLRDRFGVDDDDCEISTAGIHGAPDQVAMWVLQHHRRPGHRPWVTVVHVDRRVSGNLI